MNRLLAKLPRSSNGSRDASASSSASRCPSGIFDVSIKDAVAFGSLSPVSALTWSGGASRDDFMSVAKHYVLYSEQKCQSGSDLMVIKFRSLARMFSQK